MAADTLSKLVLDLNDIEKRRHRRKYIKRMQRFMEDRFTPELKKLTRTEGQILVCLLYTSPSPRDKRQSRMPSSA